MKLRIRAGLLALLVTLFIPVTSASAVTQTDQLQQDLNKAMQEQQAIVRKQLDDARKAICNQQAAGINMIKDFLANVSEAQINYVRGWNLQVIDYKVAKKLEFSNYQQLYVTAEEKYDAAYTALANFKAIPDFKCDSSGPFSDFMYINVQYMALFQAIFAYIVAVMNLFMGVLMAEIQAFMTQAQADMQASMTQLQNDARARLNSTTGGNN